MESAEWGVETDPLPLWGIFDATFSPTDSDDPWEIPAVKAAGELGFEPAPEAPLWAFLPAIWPDEARAWIPDTRVRHMQGSSNGEPARTVPWSTATYFEMESDANKFIAMCGLPARPPGRLWLLKPPHRFGSLQATLTWLAELAEDAGLDIMASRPFALRVQLDLETLFASGT